MEIRIVDDGFNQRWDELKQAIEELARVIETSSPAPIKREPKLSFPFSLLAWAISSGLGALNRAVGWLVKKIIR
jgi:hypothetical protein